MRWIAGAMLGHIVLVTKITQLQSSGSLAQCLHNISISFRLKVHYSIVVSENGISLEDIFKAKMYNFSSQHKPSRQAKPFGFLSYFYSISIVSTAASGHHWTPVIHLYQYLSIFLCQVHSQFPFKCFFPAFLKSSNSNYFQSHRNGYSD